MPRTERPLEPDDGPLTEFAARLRILRKEAGSPPYRELARRAHFSSSTLSDAAGGRRLPNLDITLAYVRACGGDEDVWRSRWHEVAAELARSEPAEPAAVENKGAPYVGLAAFRTEDAALFFGRETMVDKLLTRLTTQRFVAVFGASGEGKSSLLSAGLIPRFTADVVSGEHHPHVVFTPGAHPVEELGIRLAGLLDRTPGELHADLTADPRNLHRLIRHLLSDAPPEIDLLVVVDQFEEVFTLCHDPDERAAFLGLLLTAVNDPGSRVRGVLGVRSDFYPHCARHPELVQAIEDSQVLLGAMTVEEFRRAVTRPAMTTGCAVEAALLTQLVADAASRVGTLPLVSHALLETWRRRRGNTLTLTGYQAAGGIRSALAQTAETCYLALDLDQQRVVKQLFLRLVALGEDIEDTKRRVPRRELDIAGPLLDQLATARLISLDRDTVELTHEALIRAWPRLRDWISGDRERLRIHRQLTDATDVWEAHGRDPDTLYSGARLAQAHERLTDILTNRERDFLDASTAREAARKTAARRRTRRLQQFVAVLSVLVVLLAGTVLYAINAERDAARQRNTALALKAAGEVAVLVDADASKAVKVALAARSLASTPETAEALIGANTAIHQRDTPLSGMRATFMISPRADVAVSPKSTNGPAMLWSLSGESAARTAHLDFEYVSLRISADAKIMLTRDQTFRTDVWDIGDLKNPRKVGTLPGRQDVQELSQDGRITLTDEKDTSGQTTKTMMWDLTDPRHPKPITLPNSNPSSMRPDGRGLVTSRTPMDGASDQAGNFLEIWQLTASNQWTLQTKLTPDDSWLPSYPKYAGNGRFVTTRDASSRIRVWRVRDDGALEEWVVIDTEVQDSVILQLTDDGRFAFAETAGVIRIWNIEKRLEPRLLARIRGPAGLLSLIPLVDDGAFHLYDSWMRLWQLDLDVDRVTSRLCRDKTQELTSAEWARYFPGAPQQSPCSR